MNKKQKQNRINEYIFKIGLKIFFFLFISMFNLFFLAFYAMLAFPWLILFFGENGMDSQGYVHKVVAFLSGNPGAESVDEGNLAQAVVVLLLICGVLLKIYLHFKGSNIKSRKEVILKKLLYFKCILAFLGWTILGISKYSEQGYESIFASAGFGIVTCAMFWIEYKHWSTSKKFDVNKMIG